MRIRADVTHLLASRLEELGNWAAREAQNDELENIEFDGLLNELQQCDELMISKLSECFSGPNNEFQSAVDATKGDEGASEFLRIRFPKDSTFLLSDLKVDFIALFLKLIEIIIKWESGEDPLKQLTGLLTTLRFRVGVLWNDRNAAMILQEVAEHQFKREHRLIGDPKFIPVLTLVSRATRSDSKQSPTMDEVLESIQRLVERDMIAYSEEKWDNQDCLHISERFHIIPK